MISIRVTVRLAIPSQPEPSGPGPAKMRGVCKAIPDRLINLPRDMNYTDNRLTANDHAGKQFEDIIDLVRELKVKADRWDAHEAQQRLDGNNQPADIFTNNPDPATRSFLDEAIHRFIDVRLRSRTYSLKRFFIKCSFLTHPYSLQFC